MNNFIQINVLDRQSLDDIAIQEYGDIDGKWLLLSDNSDRLQSIDDVPAPGMVLNIETPVPYISPNNQSIAAYFASKGIKVISGATLPSPSIPYPQQHYVTPGYWLPGYATPVPGIITLGNISNTPAPPEGSGG